MVATLGFTHCPICGVAVRALTIVQTATGDLIATHGVVVCERPAR